MRSLVFGEIDVHMPLKIVLFFFTDSNNSIDINIKTILSELRLHSRRKDQS